MKNPNVHTQKEIRNAIKWGLAKNVSNADPKEFKGHKFNKIWVSKGVYGMNVDS